MLAPTEPSEMPDRFISGTKAALGISAPFVGLLMSWMPHIRDGLQVLSLMIGCAVGLVTLRNALRKSK